VSRQEQSHSDGPENNSCQKIEITGSKKMPYNHDYSEDVERRSDTMKHPINWVHMSTFDCLNKTKRHCSLINLIVMIISDWLTRFNITHSARCPIDASIISAILINAHTIYQCRVLISYLILTYSAFVIRIDAHFVD
jgi:hypothetical protein